VGLVARAANAFGITDLVLVGGVSPTHPHALAAAAGGEPILQAARQVATLRVALAGSDLAIGTTAREYARPDLRVIPVREAAALTSGFGRVAWVFGTEKHGLTAADLQRCHQAARIPASGPSLNLSQAVAICLYEAAQANTAARAAAGEPDSRLPAGVSVDPEDLEGWLLDLGVAKAKDARSKAHTMARIASRLQLDADESALVAAIARHLFNE
jgi:TrmH family RNA methyltransferase